MNLNTPVYAVCQGGYSTQYDQGKSNSSLSFFSRDNIAVIDVVDIINAQKASSFSFFINSRSIYLENLKKLGDNWISGSSV